MSELDSAVDDSIMNMPFDVLCELNKPIDKRILNINRNLQELRDLLLQVEENKSTDAEYIVIQNPHFVEDNGSNPNLVIETNFPVKIHETIEEVVRNAKCEGFRRACQVIIQMLCDDGNKKTHSELAQIIATLGDLERDKSDNV